MFERINVTPEDFFKALIAARGTRSDVESLPGAFIRRHVSKNSYGLRPLLPKLADLSSQDKASFIKSLALYEQTIGGLGSPTLLLHALPAADDPEHTLFDWVVSNTSSYDYYTRGAQSFDELESMKAADRARADANLERERQRAAEAAVRHSDMASANLVGAIRRGDIKAVDALLRKGANPQVECNLGMRAPAYAEAMKRPAIAKLLRSWQRGS